jgi:hypothetical protein
LKVYENRVLRIIFGPEGMSPIQRPERGWSGNNKIDLKVTDVTMDRIQLAQDRFQWKTLGNTVTNFRVPKEEENFLSN